MPSFPEPTGRQCWLITVLLLCPDVTLKSFSTLQRGTMACKRKPLYHLWTFGWEYRGIKVMHFAIFPCSIRHLQSKLPNVPTKRVDEVNFMAVLVLGVNLGVLGSSSGHLAGWAFPPSVLFTDHLMVWVLVLILLHSALGKSFLLTQTQPSAQGIKGLD